jgi:hypothetical protein
MPRKAQPLADFAPQPLPGTAAAVVQHPTDQLVPYVANARTHSQQQIEAVARSIEQFGFNAPILVRGTTVVAGHCRLAAAQLLGLPTVPTIQLAHLSERDMRAYIIADNRLAEVSGWDDAVLKAELEQLMDLGVDVTALGWDTMPDFLDTPDTDILNELDNTDLENFRDGKRGIQIEFDPEDYDTAYELCNQLRKQGTNLGKVVLAALQAI